MSAKKFDRQKLEDTKIRLVRAGPKSPLLSLNMSHHACIMFSMSNFQLGGLEGFSGGSGVAKKNVCKVINKPSWLYWTVHLLSFKYVYYVEILNC